MEGFLVLILFIHVPLDRTFNGIDDNREYSFDGYHKATQVNDKIL